MSRRGGGYVLGIGTENKLVCYAQRREVSGSSAVTGVLNIFVFWQESWLDVKETG